MTSSPGPGAISIERNVGSRLVWLEGPSNDSKSVPFPSCLPQFLQLAFEGNPTAVLGEDAGVTVAGLSPVTGTAVREAPELPEEGDVPVFKHDVESNLRVVQRWRRHVQLAWPVRC